jgi:pimeloyl-ACP methyl ester carboxylesterase
MKPTILLIHGALHDPSIWDLVSPKLEALKYAVTTVQLRTSNPSAPNLTPYDDVAAIHEIMFPLFNEGKEVVVIAHSYGACPGLASIEGNSIAERREKGSKGGVKSVMFISSVLISERGKSCADTHYDVGSDWADIDMEVSSPLANSSVINLKQFLV